MESKPLQILLVEDNPGDARLFQVTNSIEEATAFLVEKAIKPFGLKPAIRRPSSLLGEREL